MAKRRLVLGAGVLLLTVAAGALSACGGDGSSSSGTGLPGTKRLDALSTDEKKQLCDYEAQRLGGYGQVVDCGGGLTLVADDSQASCLQQFPLVCAATVSQAEACADQSSCSDPVADVCMPLLNCGLND